MAAGNTKQQFKKNLKSAIFQYAFSMAEPISLAKKWIEDKLDALEYRPGTLLVTFGFSFGDKHILDITKRALKNPTLKLVVFSFEDADRDSFLKIFGDYNNVDIITPGTLLRIDFAKFNGVLRSLLPVIDGKKK